MRTFFCKRVSFQFHSGAICPALRTATDPRPRLPPVNVTNVKVLPPATPNGGTLVIDDTSGSFSATPGLDRVDLYYNSVSAPNGQPPQAEFQLPANTASKNEIQVVLPPWVPAPDQIRVEVLPASGGTPLVSPLVTVGYPAISYVYVVNGGDNSVSVIDTNIPPDPNNPTKQVIARIQVGQNPTAVAVTPDGRYAFVTNSGDGTISVIDARTLQLVDFRSVTPGTIGALPGQIQGLKTMGHPNYIAIDPTQPFGYATDLYSGMIYRFSTNVPQMLLDRRANGFVSLTQSFDITGGTFVTGLTGVTFSADGKTAYVASPGSASYTGVDSVAAVGYVFVVDPATNKLIPPAFDTGPKPFGVTAAPA